MTARKSTPRVTRADVDRAIKCFQRLGGQIAEVEVTPGRVRLISTNGRDISLNDAELDEELERWQAKHDRGQPERAPQLFTTPNAMIEIIGDRQADPPTDDQSPGCYRA